MSAPSPAAPLPTQCPIKKKGKRSLSYTDLGIYEKISVGNYAEWKRASGFIHHQVYFNKNQNFNWQYIILTVYLMKCSDSRLK